MDAGPFEIDNDNNSIIRTAGLKKSD